MGNTVPVQVGQGSTDDKLRERIKELRCLYAVARIAQTQDLGLEPLLAAIVRTIPQGFQFPDHLGVLLEVDNTNYDRGTKSTAPSGGHRLEVELSIDRERRGRLVIFYPAEAPVDAKTLFLPEEEQLLEKLAIEVANIVERQEKRERQRLFEARMLQNDRLTVLGELTAGIAHELNTPLGNVLGYAELLKSGEHDPARREDLQRIIDSALIGREVVKRLMYFSCEMPSQFRVQDVNEVIRGVLRLLHRQLEEHAVELRAELQPGPANALLDRVQLEQVLINLVLNALAATARGGVITISSTTSNAHTVMKVQDNGKGIAPEHLRKIFQPFFTTKAPGEGTGLGLAVVHGIIKAHKGAITVDSGLGVGSTFTLTLPAA